MPRQARQHAADRVRALHDIDGWPDLRFFNSSPCERHAPDLVNPVLCRDCGIILRRHQRIGAAWMYLGLPGLLSDGTGSGKTATVLAMLAMCKENGELGLHNRAVIVCKSAAVHDPWGNELRRLMPGVSFFIADGNKDQRIRGYMGNWEIAVVGDRTFGGAHGQKTQRDGDVALLEQFPVGILVYDDIDPMRNHESETARAVNRLASRCTRVCGMHATPLQKRLEELWCFLLPVGGRDALGSLERVRQRFVAMKRRQIYVKDPKDQTGRTRMVKVVYETNGITTDPARVREFQAAVRPLVLRRTAAQMDDVALPLVRPNPVFLDLNPRQRQRYNELRAGALRRLKDGSEKVTMVEAGEAFTRGAQICSGLATLDDGLDDSVKLDWVMDKLTGDLWDEKLVAFVYFRPNVRALALRLQAAGIGGVLIWSGNTDKRVRAARLARFREDPRCRVLVGTTSIEASLNLQVTRHMAAVDTLLNPARMTQLVGRMARQGSPYPTVYFHHLLAKDTQEDGYLPLLRREAGISDTVWNETNDLFTAGLSPRQRLQLVATGRITA